MRRAYLLSPLIALAALALPAQSQTSQNTAAANATRIAPQPPAPPQAERRSGAYSYLADLSRGFVTAQTQYSANVISETFAAALQRSRDAVREGSKPIPEAVIKGLMPFYPESLLREVRYNIGDTSQTGLAGFAIRNGNAAAVTLIDTIVFANPQDSETNVALWAHEVKHVEQFRRWGLMGFAQAYVRDHEAVEAEAYAIGNAVKAFHGGG